MNLPIKVNIRVDESPKALRLRVADNNPVLRLKSSDTINVSIMGDTYDGDYEVTPRDNTIVLATKELMMTDNVVINPIPNNYGKIGWNGSYLTVT